MIIPLVITAKSNDDIKYSHLFTSVTHVDQIFEVVKEHLLNLSDLMNYRRDHGKFKTLDEFYRYIYGEHYYETDNIQYFVEKDNKWINYDVDEERLMAEILPIVNGEMGDDNLTSISNSLSSSVDSTSSNIK
jgi:hypothetical protein